MKNFSRFLVLFIGCLLLLVGSVRAIDQAMPNVLPSNHPALPDNTLPPGPIDSPPAAANTDRPAFRAAIHLDAFRTLLVQHNEQVKILDSWARQSIAAIRNLQSIDGEDPLFTALDMAFRPDAWADKNIIYVQAIPIRQQMAELVTDPAERERIVTHATVSPRFVARKDVQDLLQRIATNVSLSQAVTKVQIAQDTFLKLYLSLRMVSPQKAGQPWLHPEDFAGNAPEMVKIAQENGTTLPALPGVDVEYARRIVLPFYTLAMSWGAGEADNVNLSLDAMAKAYPQINPAEYSTPFARKLELFYNLTFNGTIVAFVYFLAFALFAVGAMADQKRTRRAGLFAFALAVACHIAAMSIRWYLAGRIPIQNQFESVLGAALIGCIVGLIAESIKRNGLFGMAFAFVGFLAMTCCFVFPFVIGKSIGENIGKVAGILNNTAWLYIHVNTVIASYALIAAAAELGLHYLIVKTWHWINPLDDGTTSNPSPASVGANEVMFQTAGGQAAPMGDSVAVVEERRRSHLAKIDAATIILLQMAFWVLGTGIVFGAIWADVSWGRPWGWDPKETFALVTWIVYLVIIHVRFITPKNRATITAALAVVGLIIMLFNWIGVNFFLAGLHSYA